MALDITISIAGTPSEIDIRSAQDQVNRENARRLIDLDENGDPKLPQLPDGNLGQLASSYTWVLENVINRAHASYAEQSDEEKFRDAKARWDAATDAQREAALAQLPEV